MTHFFYRLVIVHMMSNNKKNACSHAAFYGIHFIILKGGLLIQVYSKNTANQHQKIIPTKFVLSHEQINKSSTPNQSSKMKKVTVL